MDTISTPSNRERLTIVVTSTGGDSNKSRINSIHSFKIGGVIAG